MLLIVNLSHDVVVSRPVNSGVMPPEHDDMTQAEKLLPSAHAFTRGGITTHSTRLAIAGLSCETRLIIRFRLAGQFGR